MDNMYMYIYISRFCICTCMYVLYFEQCANWLSTMTYQLENSLFSRVSCDSSWFCRNSASGATPPQKNATTSPFDQPHQQANPLAQGQGFIRCVSVAICRKSPTNKPSGAMAPWGRAPNPPPTKKERLVDRQLSWTFFWSLNRSKHI